MVLFTQYVIGALPPRYQNIKDLDVMVNYIKEHPEITSSLKSIDFFEHTIYFGNNCKTVFGRISTEKPSGWTGPADPLQFIKSNCGDKPINKTGYQSGFKVPTMSCVCTATACGNYAVGGNQGDIYTSVSANDVRAKFITNPNTGWHCFVPDKIRGNGGPKGCYCGKYCGNGGVGADPGYIDLGLTRDTIKSSYGGGKPGNKTNWLCGNSRGAFSSQ